MPKVDQAMAGIGSVKHTVALSSNTMQGCDECADYDGRSDSDALSVVDLANHYVANHDYMILHVGQETTRTDEGDLWHSTVVVLGTRDPDAASRIEARRKVVVRLTLDDK